MPTVVTNPLSGLLDGMLQGYSLANQIKHQAMQEEAFQREKMRQDREMQVQDIQTRMMLDQNARPVQAGTVQDLLPAAPEIPGQPKMEGGNPQIPYVRPVDKSRRVAYKSRDGQTQEYELHTPEEQMKRKVEQASSMKRAGSTLIKTPKHLQEIGLPAEIYVPDDHVMQYAEQAGLLQPMDTPQIFQQMGGPAQLPVKSLPSVVSAVNSAENRKATDARSSANIASRESVARENRTAANARAADANATRIKTAGMRRDTSVPTANAQGVQNRFQQRQLESDQKELRALEQKEAGLHAKKLEEGQSQPADPKNGEAFAKTRNSKLSALDLQIKGIQEAKKKLIDKWQGKATPQAAQAKQLTDPNVAKQYLEKAGGDKDKARKLAAADGWTF